MKTFWLYWYDKVLTAVRAPEGSSDDDIRYRAYACNQRIPLSRPEYNPREFGNLLLNAEVRTFGDPAAPMVVNVKMPYATTGMPGFPDPEADWDAKLGRFV